MIKNFYSTYGYHHVKIWVLHLLCLLGLIFLSFDYFILSLILCWFFLPLYSIIFHDWISHEYIMPKNKIIKLCLLVVFYSQENIVKKKKSYHIWHHKNFADPELDPTSQKLKDKTFLAYILGFHKPIEQNIPNFEFSLIEKDSLIKFCDRYHKIIWGFLLIITFIFLPLEWFVVINVYIPWLSVIVSNAHDYYFHGPINGKDSNLLSLLIGNAAWHIEHHENWRQEHYGYKNWKYFNPMWYYRILLFKK